jgi:hypothetical protein
MELDRLLLEGLKLVALAAAIALVVLTLPAQP